MVGRILTGLYCWVRKRKVDCHLNLSISTVDYKGRVFCAIYLFGDNFLKDSVYGIFICIISSSQLTVLITTHSIYLPFAVHKDYVLLASTKARYIFVYYPEFDECYWTELALASKNGTFPHPIRYLFDYFCCHASSA